MPSKHHPPLEIRLRVLSAVDHAPGESIRARIRQVATLKFTDQLTGQVYQFTWRTISTWLYRFKLYGVAMLENKTRTDKNQPRKVSISQLAEAIHEVLPCLSRNKSGVLPKSVLYRMLLQKGFFTRSQLSPTTFYRHIRAHDLLKETVSEKLRLSFAMQFANELWQDRYDVHGCTNAAGAWMRRSGRCMDLRLNSLTGHGRKPF